MPGDATGSGDDLGPPSPGHRPWLHPSELPVDPEGGARPDGRRRNPWLATTAGLAGVLAVVGLVSVALESAASRSAPATTSSLGITLVPAGVEVGDPDRLAQASGPAIFPVTAWESSMARHGSAVVYSSDGVLLTSATVVDGADSIEVKMADGSLQPAELVGTDHDADLALLSIGVSGLPPLSFDRDPAVREGQRCVAVGTPPSPHRGLVLTGATVDDPRAVVEVDHNWMVGVLAVDSRNHRLEPGSALFDPDGRLLGVVTGRVTGDDRTIVVPTVMVRESAEQLLREGWVSHAWLGIAAADHTDPPGALVVDVAPASPADEAGVAAGDVIVAVDGGPVSGMADLMLAVRGHRVGETLALTVVREGETTELAPRLVERP